MSDSVLSPKSSSVTCALPMRGSKINSSFSCSQMARLTSSGALQATAAQQSRRLLLKELICWWRKASRAGVSGTAIMRLISAVSYHWFTMTLSWRSTSDHLLIIYSPNEIHLPRQRARLTGIYVGAESTVNQDRARDSGTRRGIGEINN